MSTTMDSQDLHGYLRGLCLILIVRATSRTLSQADASKVLRETFAPDIKDLLSALASFTNMEEPALMNTVDELCQADEDFIQADSINLQLGLLSGRPVPVFRFVDEQGVDQRALIRPFLDTAENFVHTAVRLRMQSLPSSAPEEFWRAVARFLRRVGGDDDVAMAMAVSTIANVISDVIFFNTEAPGRTDDPILAARISRVLTELRTINIADVIEER